MAAKGLSIDNNGGHCERYPTKEPGSKSKAEGVFMFEVSAADAPPAF